MRALGEFHRQCDLSSPWLGLGSSFKAMTFLLKLVALCKLFPHSVFVTEHKFVCLMHSEAKQYQNVGVWSREMFIAGQSKEKGGGWAHAPQTPEFPEEFQQSIFKGQVR